jgi:hypothetical protein
VIVYEPVIQEAEFYHSRVVNYLAQFKKEPDVIVAIVSHQPEPANSEPTLRGTQAARGRAEAAWPTCCHEQPLQQQPAEEPQDFADIEGYDPQLQRRRTALLPEPEACRSLRLTTQHYDRGDRVLGKGAR